MNQFSRPEPTHRRTLRMQRDRLIIHPAAPLPVGADLELSLGRMRRDTHRTRVQVVRLAKHVNSVHLTDGSDLLRGHMVELLAAMNVRVTWQPLTDPAAPDHPSTHADERARRHGQD